MTDLYEIPCVIFKWILIFRSKTLTMLFSLNLSIQSEKLINNIFAWHLLDVTRILLNHHYTWDLPLHQFDYFIRSLVNRVSSILSHAMIFFYFFAFCVAQHTNSWFIYLRLFFVSFNFSLVYNEAQSSIVFIIMWKKTRINFDTNKKCMCIMKHKLQVETRTLKDIFFR